MKTELLTGQVFCLRNWAVCANSLRIKVSASYSDDLPEETAELDLIGGSGGLEGLIIIINPDPSHAGALFIGPDFNSSVSKFTIELENTGLPIRNLQLEYAMVNAQDAFTQNGNWNFIRLVCDKIEFTASDSGFAVEMTVSSGSIASEEGSDSEIPSYDKEDIIGNIEADLRMISYFGSASEVKEIVSILTDLLNNSKSMSAEKLAEAAAFQERRLISCINRTQEDIRRYREALLEDISPKSRRK